MKKNLWEKYSKKNCTEQTTSIRLHAEQGIDSELRSKFITLVKRLRKEYVFPISVSIYIVNSEKVTMLSGAKTYGSFRWFSKRTPRIKVAAAYEKDQLEKYGKEELDIMIMSSLIHELTHYYQYCSGAEQSKAVSERQANYFRYSIIEKLMPELF